MLPTPFTITTEKRQNRSLIQDVTPFLNNIIFQYTNPLPFETEPHILHTIPLVREHCDSYLYYIQYKTLDITPSQTPFQVIFNPIKGINSRTFYRTIHPKKNTLSIQDVFRTYMQKLIEFNENQDTPLYRPSHLQEFLGQNHSVKWYPLQFFKTFLAFGSERRFVKIEGFLSSFSALRVFSRREQCFEKKRFSKNIVLMFPVSCGKKRFRVLGVLFRVSLCVFKTLCSF